MRHASGASAWPRDSDAPPPREVPLPPRGADDQAPPPPPLPVEGPALSVTTTAGLMVYLSPARYKEPKYPPPLCIS